MMGRTLNQQDLGSDWALVRQLTHLSCSVKKRTGSLKHAVQLLFAAPEQLKQVS